MRTYDVGKIRRATYDYMDEIKGFYPEEWIEDELNVALINDNGDIALFENQASLKNTVCGHYFFFSRGKQAVEAAQEFLKEIFSDSYQINTILGLTPTDNRGALWMNKRLGFTEVDTIDTETGPCRFVLLTKQDWKIINE